MHRRRVSFSVLPLRALALASAAILALGVVACSQEDRAYESSARARDWSLGGKKVELEVAKDQASRMRGLMHRKSMPEDHGMLFVYPEPRILGFWMQNTAIPLSIAFFEELPDQPGKARIINIEDMQPMVESTTASLRPCRLALEMNQGWFARHGVKAGDVVEIPSWIQEIVASEDQ